LEKIIYVKWKEKMVEN